MTAHTDAVGTAPSTMTLTRLHVVEQLARALADHCWAFQGSSAAVGTWVDDDTLADLDLWTSPESVTAVDDVLRRCGGVLVCATDHARRLRHRQYWMPTAQAGTVGAIVDVTVGDLRVGPVLLTPATAVHVTMTDLRVAPDRSVHAPVLAGVARVADLALRPLLRGRVVGGPRLAEARHEHLGLGATERAMVAELLGAALGTAPADTVCRWLSGDEPDEVMAAVVTVARRRLAVRSLAPASLRSTWAQRSLILPSRRVGPAGLRSRGLVVALVGTDGSGKSTTARRLGDELTHAGFDVVHEYFGMARGNLPGVGLMRRLAGGGDTSACPDADASSGDSAPAGLLQRAAAWVYVVDYLWRSARRVRPQVRRGRVVLCDRWVSDLRRHPAPGTPAARVGEWLVGAPQVIVLADAPVAEMVARKPERTLAAAAAEQRALREVGLGLDGRRARGGGTCTFHVVDTSAGSTSSTEVALLPVVRAIVASAHRGLPGAQPERGVVGA